MPSWGPTLGLGRLPASDQPMDGCVGSAATPGPLEGCGTARLGLQQALAKGLSSRQTCPGSTRCPKGTGSWDHAFDLVRLWWLDGEGAA